MNPLDLIKNITPLKKEVSSGWATFWALIFGGVGLGIYVRVSTDEWSGADFLLPIIFAVGLRLLSLPAGGAAAVGATEDDDRIYFGNVGGAIAAGVCFAIVLAAIGLGIYWIVSS